MINYEYKFVIVKINTWTGKPKEDYQAIIQEHGRQGWRLSQIIPYTHSRYVIELIFERSI